MGTVTICRRCYRAIWPEMAEQCAVAACPLCEECWELYGYCPHHTERELDGVLGARNRPKDVSH